MHVLKHYLGISKELPPRYMANSTLVPVGLENGSNNCYCNAVLQALFPANDFREGVIRLMYSEAEITSCLGRLYERCTSSSGRRHFSVSTNSRHTISKETPSEDMQEKWYASTVQNSFYLEEFIMGDQQDAHEFLTYLINTMIDEMKILDKNRKITTTTVHLRDTDGSMDHARLKPKDKCNLKDKQQKAGSQQKRDWLSKLVEGYLRSETKCHKCNRISGTVEPFITLSLDIFENSTIEDCIERYCAAELLTGKDRFFCDFCKDYCDASRSVVFEELPPVLIIHLKRFKFNMPQAESYHRGHHEPFERLQYSVISNRELILESRKQRYCVDYELFSIVCHVGTSPHYGHYVTISEVNKKWYSCDDLTTTKVGNVNEELGDDTTDGNSNSYILFYRMAALGTV